MKSGSFGSCETDLAQYKDFCHEKFPISILFKDSKAVEQQQLQNSPKNNNVSPSKTTATSVGTGGGTEDSDEINENKIDRNNE